MDEWTQREHHLNPIPDDGLEVAELGLPLVVSLLQITYCIVLAFQREEEAEQVLAPCRRRAVDVNWRRLDFRGRSSFKLSGHQERGYNVLQQPARRIWFKG